MKVLIIGGGVIGLLTALELSQAGCEVTLLDKQDFGQADQYVIATGAWSGLLSEQFDWQVPVKPIQGQMILFKAPAQWLPTMVMHQGIYLIPRLDGHIVCGSSTDDVGFNTDVNIETGLKLQQTAYRLAPELQDMPRVHAWAGLRPSVPDGVPYIAPGRGRQFIGSAEVLRMGRKGCTTRMNMHNDEGKLIATGIASYAY
jgi:glycine/D-amino acid oxidase-like deaminating enzyme